MGDDLKLKVIGRDRQGTEPISSKSQKNGCYCDAWFLKIIALTVEFVRVLRYILPSKLIHQAWQIGFLR